MLQRENTKIFFEAFSAIIAMKIEVNLFDSKTIAMDEVRVLISHPSILPFTFVKLETFFPLVSLSLFPCDNDFALLSLSRRKKLKRLEKLLNRSVTRPTLLQPYTVLVTRRRELY